MQVPDPNSLTLEAWYGGTMAALNNTTLDVGIMLDDDWHTWGMLFFNSPTTSILGPPNPYDYTDWVPWAERLADCLNNVAGGATTNEPETQSWLITQTGIDILTQLGQNILTQTLGH